MIPKHIDYPLDYQRSRTPRGKGEALANLYAQTRQRMMETRQRMMGREVAGGRRSPDERRKRVLRALGNMAEGKGNYGQPTRSRLLAEAQRKGYIGRDQAKRFRHHGADEGPGM